MTIPQARLLQRHYADVDGHRETARRIVDSLVDLAVAGGLVKRADPSTSPRRPEAEAAAVIIPDLEAVMERALLAKGWQPPQPEQV